MDHVAIMRKSWGLTKKILSGEKKIESRWYKSRYAPWDRIEAGDTVYFKDSGDPVTIRAKVWKVIQFSGLKPKKVREILDKYGKADGLWTDDIPRFFDMFKHKNYCILIFLKDPQKLEQPFEIDKTGFGAMCSWMTVDDVNNIKVKK